jgi:hypothetical protein
MKAGDKLIAKNTFYTNDGSDLLIIKDKYYTVIQTGTTEFYNDEYFSIINESKSEYKFYIDQIEKFFYSKEKLRKFKLQEIQDQLRLKHDTPDESR